MMTFIDIKNLCKSYGNKKAVDNVSLVIEEGEVFGLLGPNGAGKSTLISMLSTLLKPDAGEITVGGYGITEKPSEIKKFFGLVPQDIALYPTLTAKENLLFWGRMYGLSGRLLKERVEEGLQLAGLSDRAKDKIESFSGGMKRRINVAAALLHHPKAIIMDEPTVGIDPQSRNHILETVRRLNREGMTVIYTSHYMEEVEFLCTRIAIMDQGRVIAVGNKEELQKLVGETDTIHIGVSSMSGKEKDFIEKIEGVDSVVVGEDKITISVKDADSILASVISQFDALKCRIQSINIEEPNLERVFLHLTGRALRD
jgi:ABC-2 type transport system ATP-binding protein